MPRQISEERTRKELIDPQLEKAGWYLRDHSKARIEIPVDGYEAERWMEQHILELAANHPTMKVIEPGK